VILEDFGMSEHAIILVYCHFLLPLQKKVTKEKESGNENFNLFWQNALGFTLPKKVEVHTISGLPPHDPHENAVNNDCKVLKKR
jgi:hypothetical protein